MRGTVGKCVNVASMCVAVAVMNLRGWHLCMSIFFLLWMVFPFLYVAAKFAMSDCLNKKRILEDRHSMDRIMVFEDSRRNIRLSNFSERECANSYFWTSTASLFMALMALMAN